MNKDKLHDTLIWTLLIAFLLGLAFFAGIGYQRISNGDPLLGSSQSDTQEVDIDIPPLTQEEKDGIDQMYWNQLMREEAQERQDQHQRCAQWVAIQDGIPPEKPLMETCREFKEKDPAGFVALFGYAPAPRPCEQWYVQDGIKTCVAGKEW